MKIFVLDTETGGLDMRVHSLLSVGALVGDLETGEILEKFEAFVKLPSAEDYNVTEGAFKVHGITVEQCMEEGLPPEEIGEMMMDMFLRHGCQLYGGHNVDIDRKGVCIHLFNIDPEDWNTTFTYRKIDTHDVVRLFLGIEGMKSGATLGQITKGVGIDMSDVGGNKFHTALFDAIATFRVMHRFRSAFRDERFLPIINKPNV
jgi:DNA polymerase III epsilon subunit-like protein